MRLKASSALPPPMSMLPHGRRGHGLTFLNWQGQHDFSQDSYCACAPEYGRLTPAMAERQIADAKLEEAILHNPQLRGPRNHQAVRSLRSLRDAAFTLWSYGRHRDCERLVANIRELIAGPNMGSLGGNDEEEANKQIEAREPKFSPARPRANEEIRVLTPYQN